MNEAVPNRKRPALRYTHVIFFALLLFCIGAGALGGLLFVHSMDLPQVRRLQDYRPDVITEIYARNGSRVASFALEQRMLVDYEEIPLVLQDAIISVEDRRFWRHWGVDVTGVARAALVDLWEWRIVQGGSTLTQQLSRLLFLSPDKRFRRKLEEMLLAIQIERHFTKPQILTFYCNQIYLGHGNYGFRAAARSYFGKDLGELTLPEAALLAGLHRNPGAYSPIRHPDRAKARRNLVLSAMLRNGKISPEQELRAKQAPLGVKSRPQEDDLAPYFVEEVRKQLETRFGSAAVHERGLRVYTTLDVKLQQVAEKALREGLRKDDKRRGWRGAPQNILQDPHRLANGEPATLLTFQHPDWERSPRPGESVHGLVTRVGRRYAEVKVGSHRVRLKPADFSWTGEKDARKLFRPGDVVLLEIVAIGSGQARALLDQRPDVQGALVAIENRTGRILAMVGGYDFRESPFNRATQALRQAGSSFKPYLYAAALREGWTPFDTLSDEPVSFRDGSGRPWRPQNYDRKFKGEITLLRALAESRNVPAVRLLDQVGIANLVEISRRFGITSPLVPNLPLALGASEVRLLEHTAAFAAFPNHGIRLVPYYIDKVVSYSGATIEQTTPQVVEVLPASVARLVVSMLREVVHSGTAQRAKALNLPLAGKTGTTNDYTDASFLGFSPTITCGVWVGFDARRSLGPREEGARVALPIWMAFMKEALRDEGSKEFPHSPLLRSPAQVEAILHGAPAGETVIH